MRLAAWTLGMPTADFSLCKDACGWVWLSRSIERPGMRTRKSIEMSGLLVISQLEAYGVTGHCDLRFNGGRLLMYVYIPPVDKACDVATRLLSAMGKAQPSRTLVMRSRWVNALNLPTAAPGLYVARSQPGLASHHHCLRPCRYPV